MNNQGNVLEVWLDCELGPPCLVGTLAHDRGQIRSTMSRVGSGMHEPSHLTRICH